MCWHVSMKRAHIGAMKRTHTVAMKRSKLVYTSDTQPKRESVTIPHYLASPTYQVKIGEGKVKMHIGFSGAMLWTWTTVTGTL